MEHTGLKDILKGVGTGFYHIEINEEGHYIHIITNFLDHTNDSIDCYIYKEDDTYYLTDDGWFRSEVSMAGLDYQQLEGRIDRLRNRYFGVISDTQQEAFKLPLSSEEDIAITTAHFIQFLVEGYGLLAHEMINNRGGKSTI